MSIDYSNRFENNDHSKKEKQEEMMIEVESPKRLEGGLEWAAEPDEFLFFAPQNFIAFGLSVGLVLLSLSCWIFGGWYEFTVWATCLTIVLGLCVFLPEYFVNLINMAIQFALWIAFSLFLITRFLQFIVWKVRGIDINDYGYTYLLIVTPFKIAAALGVTFILFRITALLYRNR